MLGGALGVHPTFFYESLWNFVGLLLVYHMGKRRKFDGQCFLFYIFWYGLGRAWIEGLRTDSLYLYVGSNIRVSQLLAAASGLSADLREKRAGDPVCRPAGEGPRGAEQGGG